MIKTISYLEHDARVFITNKEDHIQKHWIQGVFYEANRDGMLNYLYQTYRGKLKNFVDIGACIGNHTLFFHRCMGADFVLSFEPYDAAMKHMENNLFLNRIPAERQVSLPIALGASEQSGRMALYGDCNTVGVEGVSPNIGMCKFMPDADGLTPMSRLDYVFDGHVAIPDPDFIKIDAEGYEMEILSGARETIHRTRPLVSIEVEPESDLPKFDAIMANEFEYKRVGPRLNYTPTFLYTP